MDQLEQNIEESEIWYKSLAFVVNLSQNSYDKIKLDLINCIKVLDYFQDSFYIYHPDYQVENTSGKWTKQIMDYKEIHNLNLRHAIKECVDFCNINYNYDVNKNIFIFLESFDNKLKYEFYKSLKYDLNFYDNCYFNVFSFSNKCDFELLNDICSKHPRCDYKHLDKIEDLVL